MDTGKLLNVLDDILIENEDNQITEKLSELYSHVNQSIDNNTSKAINTTIEEIKKLVVSSVFNAYSISNNKILEKIEGKQFFGNGLIESIRGILKSNFPREQIDQLNQFINNRNNFIDKIRQTKTNLEGLNFEKDFHTNDYEIGFLISPPEYSNQTESFNSFENVNKLLHKLNTLLKNLGEITNDKNEIIIHKVNNGSLEFYIQAGLEIAKNISVILASILIIYEKLKTIRENKNSLKEQGVDENIIKSIEKEEKSIVNKQVESAVRKIIDEYFKKDDKGRKNELTNGIRNGIHFIVKSIEKGIQVEINPPSLQETERKEEVANIDEASDTVTFVNGETMTIAEYREYQKEEDNKLHHTIVATSQNIQNLKIENLNITHLINTEEDTKNNKATNT